MAEKTNYRTLLMDAPWTERGGGKIKRGADRHYPLVKTQDMPALIRGSGVFTPDVNAHLWLWATNNKLPDALWLGKELGFDYKTNVVWSKGRTPETLMCEMLNAGRGAETLEQVCADISDGLCPQIGLGQYIRGSHELLLLFTRGRGQAPEVWNGHKLWANSDARSVSSVIRAPRTKHSAKPEEAHHLIERVSAGPRIELFARTTRPGWDVWGDEVPQEQHAG